MKEIIFENGLLGLENISNYIKKNRIRIVFFAETHGLIPETEIQEKIISKVNPHYFLYELLEEEKIDSKQGYEGFLSKKDDEDFSIISKFKDLKPTILLAKKFGIPIVGCDIKDMLRKDTNFREKRNISEAEMKNEETIMIKREKKQIEIINYYLNSKKDSLLFVSLGIYHLRKESFVLKNVKSNYLLIYPVFDGKEIDEVEYPTKCKVNFFVKSKIFK